MEDNDVIELKFRLPDGTDIGPDRYNQATTVATLKEKVLAQWPNNGQIGPKTVNDLKLINAGKILENHNTLGESRIPLSEIAGAIITMLVVVRPPLPEKSYDKLQITSHKTPGCSCVIL